MRILMTGALLLCVFMSVSQEKCYWQQRVEYDMDIDFDSKNHQFTGTQKLTYFNNSPDTLEKAYYHLYFNAFQPNSMMDMRNRTIEDPSSKIGDRISKLKESEIGFHKIKKLNQNDAEVSFKVEGTILEAILPQPIPPGDSTVFYMEFESQVPVQIRRSGRNNKEGIDYSMSQWYPKLAEYDERGWHTHPYIAREFYAPWGDFDVTISIDKKYILGATGILQNPDEIGYGYEDEETTVKRKGKKLEWNFVAKDVHDFVWAADPDYTHTKIKPREGITLRFFYQTDTLRENWEALPELASAAFSFMNDNFGTYPYTDYSVIQGGDGGMEYPMATLITGHRSLPSLVGVTVHEMLHSWYQGVLATNESYYAWMDEGFTTYASSLTMDKLFTGGNNRRTMSRNYLGYFTLAKSGKEEPLSTHADQFETNFAYGRGSYSKGAVTVAQLGYIIGEENLRKGLLNYYEQWKFKHPDLINFTRVMEKTSGLELDWYFDYWINSTKTIDYGIDTVYAVDKKTTIKLQRIGKIPMPVDLVVTYKNGAQEMYYMPLGLLRGEKPAESSMKRNILPDWNWTHPRYTLEIDTPLEDISTIEIDPSYRMADIERDNNTYTR